MYAHTVSFPERDAHCLQVADSFFGRWFQLEGSGHKKEREGSRFLTEIRAGLTTWVRSVVLSVLDHRLNDSQAAMAYIISVNASILKDSGGTCVCPEGVDCVTAPDDTYTACVAEVQRDLITTTAAVACLASCLMGLLANLPVGMAPGLGLNAYVSSLCIP